MSDVQVTWTTQDTSIVDGANFTKFRLSLDGVVAVVLPITEKSFKLVGVAPGSHSVLLELVSTDETKVGGNVSGSIDVPNLAVAPVPATITLALA